MAVELIRLDTTIKGIDNLINNAKTAEEAVELCMAKDVIYSQRRYTADVQPINQWTNVEERVPESSGYYLCYCSTGETEVDYFDRDIEDDEYNNNYPFGVWNIYPSDDGGECREWIEILEVTHWQPLPEPPKEG